MNRRWRIALLVALSALLLLGAAWLGLHSRGVQRMVTDRVTAAIEEQTGWRIEIDEPHLRLWPARLVATGVWVFAGDHRVVSVDRIEASWSWAAVADAPHRLRSVELTGVVLDLRDLELPPTPDAPPDAEPMDPWRVVEVGRLRLAGGLVEGRAMDVTGTLAGVRIAASLLDGRASAELEAERMDLERQDRELSLGSIGIEASASADGVIVKRFRIEDPQLGIEATGEAGFDPVPNGRVDFAGRVDIADVLEWWDPNIASGLTPEGILDFDGGAALDAEGRLTANLVHRGGTIRVAGTDLDELELGFADGVPVVRVAGSSWGRASITVIGNGVASVSARLRDARVEKILAFAAPQVAAAVPGPVSLSGSVDGTVSYPFSLDTVAGSVDLEAVSRLGRVEVSAEGRAETWTVRRFEADAASVRLSGSGELVGGDRMAAELDFEVADIVRALVLVEPWFKPPAGLVLGGGPITGTAVLSGTLGQPRFATELEWREPVLAERRLDRIAARAQGDIELVDWAVEATLDGIAAAAVEGRFVPDEMLVGGHWSIDLERMDGVLELLPAADEPLDVAGNLRAEGDFAGSTGGWSVDGAVEGQDLAVADWGLDRLDMRFDAGPDKVVVDHLSAELLGGRLSGRGDLGLEGFDARLSLALEWQGLQLEELPLEQLPEGAFGAVNGRLTAAGTLSRPTAEVELDWTPVDPASPVPPLEAAGSLEDGVLRLVTREVATELGTAIARATVPLGGLPRPGWLWPDAPDGAIRVVADGHNLRSEPLLALLGVEPLPVSASAELTLDAEWRPGSSEATRVYAELSGFRMQTAAGVVAAQAPLEFRLDNGRVRLEPAVLTGPQTRIEVGGEADLASRRIDGTLDAVVAPTVARLIPFPIQIYQPIRVTVATAGTLDAPRATITIDHPGGALVMRDPPLQIQDLKLSAEIVDGRLWINDGRAEVNQGRIELGGGWDAESGQGIVAEIDNVVVFVEGILSQWSGTVAIEPEPGRIAKMTGELNLVAGLWDQDVSLGGALFGPSSLDPSSDDPLYDIALDLDVRGRGIVRVENNLGRFDARWDVLRVTGNAAEPEIRGKISIAPGGRLSLAGQRVTVRRGSLVFTGDPAVDPVMEIVPDSDIAAFGGGDSIDTTSIATQGLVSGLAGALGFENETLQPAEISVEVEKDSSQQLMFGQRLSHNIALFFATNTTDVQDRTSMFQLWNLPGLKGLALQGYQKTLTDEVGGNLVQRFQWGGSSLYEDRPTIRKLKLDGNWPISKRRLRKATGFRRGQPYDPFLPFVAKVRMERELSGAGFQEATVTARSAESNDSWTMVFECDPGARQEVVFTGDVPPRRVREEVTAMYQPPPLERVGFRNMATALDRHLDADGHPDAAIVVERQGEMVVAKIHRGEGIELSGPVVVGASPELNRAVQERLGSPSELAMLPVNEARAKRVVERAFFDLGYPDAVFQSATKVALDEKRSEIRIEADLGARAAVAELVVTGGDPLGLTRADDFSLRVGSPLNRGKVDLAASQLRAGYDSAGYSDARVTGSMEEIAEGDWVVSIHVEPGGRRTVREVEIVGLKHTNPKVLRSGITVEEGEILRNPDVDTTAVRIANFAPIERVDVSAVPQGTDGAKVVLEVIEKPRWTTEVGAGWSTERGAQARFGIRDENLIGRGLNINLRGRWDQTEWLGFVVASLPPPPGKRFSFTTTGGFSRGDVPGDPDFSQDEPFWSFEVTRWMGRGDIAVGTAGEQITGYYRFSRTTTTEKDPCYLDPLCFDNGTTINTGLIGARYVHDRFDSPFDPTKGYGVVLDAATSREILGSDFDYWTALGNGSMATKAPLASIWVQSLRIGVAEPLQGQPLIKTAKFFAGGQGSIRGFDRDSVGPVSYDIGGWDPAGGGALLILNEELRIPVWGGLRAAVFADIGQVWKSWGEADLNFAVGAGVGIRWATPIGPVWADVAWPVVNPDVNPPGRPPYLFPVRPMSSSKPKFYIGIGRPF